jgi:hypothetical protein
MSSKASGESKKEKDTVGEAFSCPQHFGEPHWRQFTPNILFCACVDDQSPLQYTCVFWGFSSSARQNWFVLPKPQERAPEVSKKVFSSLLHFTTACILSEWCFEHMSIPTWWMLSRIDGISLDGGAYSSAVNLNLKFCGDLVFLTSPV